MITTYRLAPRYTPGSPATLGCEHRELAEQVAREELRAYWRTLSGVYGTESQDAARKLGPFGIVTMTVRTGRFGKHSTTTDLVAAII